MGKIKTHKASSKRFSVTGTGKVKLTHCYRPQKTGKKSGKALRQGRVNGYLSDAMAANYKALIQK